MEKSIATFGFVLAAGLLAVGLGYGNEAKKADEAPAAAAVDKADEAPATAAADKTEKAPPETLKFDKVGKMAPVSFPHKKHIEKLGGCKDCHEGEKPLFDQKRSEAGLKMKDLYAGAACGKCHDGKKSFAAKTGCLKCHKKIAEKN